MERIFRIEDTIERMKKISSDMETSLAINFGVSEDLIERCEKKLRIKLPDDFRKFYCFTDGTREDDDLLRYGQYP